MHLRRQQQVEPPAVVPAQRTELRVVDGRTDLACIICQQVIAYDVGESLSRADDVFYREQHAPFCRAAH